MSTPFGIPVVVTRALPSMPDHRANACRLVRRGLYDAFPWLLGDPGPNPGELTHALLIGDVLYASAHYADRLLASHRNLTSPPAVAGRHDPACSLRDTDEMPSERRCTCAADVVIRPDSLPSRAHEAKDCWCGQHHAREDFL